MTHELTEYAEMKVAFALDVVESTRDGKGDEDRLRQAAIDFLVRYLGGADTTNPPDAA